jgi:hypothetical protein
MTGRCLVPFLFSFEEGLLFHTEMRPMRTDDRILGLEYWTSCLGLVLFTSYLIRVSLSPFPVHLFVSILSYNSPRLTLLLSLLLGLRSRTGEDITHRHPSRLLIPDRIGGEVGVSRLRTLFRATVFMAEFFSLF